MVFREIEFIAINSMLSMVPNIVKICQSNMTYYTDMQNSFISTFMSLLHKQR